MGVGRRSSAPALLGLGLAAISTVLLAGCGRAGAPSPAAGSGGVRIVAAESFWGSIAAQLAGSKADVTSVVADPQTDPHSYEPTARDARMLAGARLVIVNGLGYDNWASRLLEAGESSARTVLDVGRALGLHEGANPHQWYSPSSVRAVVARIAADLQRIDPRDRAYFARREREFVSGDLARYDELLRSIRARYAGTPVGYSESIFAPLGAALGLRLLTPPGFAKAIAEGTDVTAREKQAVDAQAADRRIDVWVLNSQNVTPDVQRASELARAHGIAIVTITETLAPATATFEQWQVAQLEALAGALHAATGR